MRAEVDTVIEPTGEQENHPNLLQSRRAEWGGFPVCRPRRGSLELHTWIRFGNTTRVLFALVLNRRWGNLFADREGSYVVAVTRS